MNEHKAIGLCLKHRDPIGFEYLVKKYRKKAFYNAYGWLNNNDDALDACQEAFARAFGAIIRVKKLERFYPWFYVILRNCCMNILNDRKKGNIISDGLSLDINGEFAVNDTDTLENMVSIEENGRIQKIFDSLKPEFKEILILKYFNDMSYDEIGALLSIPRGSVMSRLYNARKVFHNIYIRQYKEV